MLPPSLAQMSSAFKAIYVTINMKMVQVQTNFEQILVKKRLLRIHLEEEINVIW